MCLSGARAAHDQILTKNHSTNLKVYVVWISYYPWDARSDINPDILGDPRVSQYWDPAKLTAQWFAEHVAGNPGGTAWDVYYLYGPDSRWGDTPSNLAASASPVIGDIDNLKARLASTT